MCKLVMWGGAFSEPGLSCRWFGKHFCGYVRVLWEQFSKEWGEKLQSFLCLGLVHCIGLSSQKIKWQIKHPIASLEFYFVIKKSIRWRNLSEHYIGKNQFFGCCRHMRWTSVLSACIHGALLNLWKPNPLRNQSSLKQCLDNAWHAGELIELTGVWPKYVCVYTACADPEAELSFPAIIPQ